MENKKEKMKDLNKQKRIWIITGIIIVIVIAAIIAGICIYHHNNKVAERNLSSYANSDDEYKVNPDNSGDTDKDSTEYIGDPDVMDDSPEAITKEEQALINKYKGKKYVLRDENGVPELMSGVMYATLREVSPEANYYYFEDGIWKPHYSGFADDALTGNTDYYVKNGIVNRNFTGIRYDGSYYWYIKNGSIQHDFSGLITYKGKTYNIYNGYALDYK